MNKDILNSGVIGFIVAAILVGISGGLEITIPYIWSLLVIFPILSVIGMSVALFLGKKFPILIQAAKFLLVGGLNTIIDLGVLNLLIFVFGATVGILFSFFKGISFIVAVLNSYVWNKYWTFSSTSTDVAKSGKEFVQFLVVSIGGLVINVGTASIVVTVIGAQFGLSDALWANVAAIAAAFTSLLWNFVGYKLIVFKK